ncbi:hypothetical protein Bca101_071586 [Brassica carinata]
MLLIHGGGVVSQVWEARNIKRGGDLPVVDMFLLDSKALDNLSKRELLTEQGDAITFESEMDRTYLGSPKVEAFLHHEQQKNICYWKIKTCGYGGHDDTDYEEVPTVGTTSTGVNNNKSLAVGTSKVAEKVRVA